MSYNIQELIKSFQYSEARKKVFPYIGDYMNQIDKWLEHHTFSDDQILRYMLVGLYIDFLATNHQGEEFNTIPQDWSDIENRPKTMKKLTFFNKVYGKPINGSEEYLNLMKLNDFNMVGGKTLFSFVIDNDAIG